MQGRNISRIKLSLLYHTLSTSLNEAQSFLPFRLFDYSDHSKTLYMQFEQYVLAAEQFGLDITPLNKIAGNLFALCDPLKNPTLRSIKNYIKDNVTDPLWKFHLQIIQANPLSKPIQCHEKIDDSEPLKFNLIAIDPKDYRNDPDKINFLGNYAKPNSQVKLLRSSNSMKVKELCLALKSSICWEKPIFEDHHLPYYAMTAYLENKITREQISHILEFHELKSTYPDLITIPILTREGNFTHACEGYLSHLVGRHGGGLPNVTREHLEKFRLSLLEYRKNLSSSFCVLHIIPNQGMTDGGWPKSRLVFPGLILGTIDTCRLGDIVTPGPVRNIFYPAITPKNSTKTISTGVLGKFSLDAIEEAHRKNIRIHALGFPGTFRTTRVHDYNMTLVEGTAHDATHQGAISYFPEHLYYMSLHCLDVLRDKTKVLRDKTEIKWSKELWPFIDMYVIDSKINVLNQTYAIDEALSDSQCQQWMKGLFKVLPKALLTIILHDMTINKSVWQQWIDVDNFVKSYDVFEAHQQPLTIQELSQTDNIHQQITAGYISNWPSITDSILGQLIYFDKENLDNGIFLSLFGEPLNKFSDEELKFLLSDIAKNNLAGIELINAAAAGNFESMEKLLESIPSETSFDYILLALRMAAKYGHEECVASILKMKKIDSESMYYQHGLEDAAIAGHTKCVKLLLENIDDESAEDAIKNALVLATKRRKSEIIDLLLEQNKFKIDSSVLVRAIFIALEHDDALIFSKLILYAFSQYEKEDLIKNLSIYRMLGLSPKNCLPVIMDIFIGHLDLTYEKIFHAIAKSGNIKSAHEFLNHINKQNDLDEVQRNNLLMQCMLEGFSCLNYSVFERYHFTMRANLQHEIVKFQIDQYLKSSAFINFSVNQNQCPRKEDIEKLLEKIFATSFKYPYQEFFTLCDIALHNLIYHPIMKKNQDLYDDCLNLAINKALHHKEQYYLRLLLKSGVSLNFSQVNDELAVNGLLIKNIPSAGVKCLVWLAYAIDEIQKFNPNDLIIRQCLQNASQDESFSNEIYSLIYSNSVKINLQILRRLDTYLEDEGNIAKVKLLINERIDFLHENDLNYTQYSVNRVNRSSDHFCPSDLEDLNANNANYLQAECSSALVEFRCK